MDNAARFRQHALALPGAVESSHMGAADFRVEGRIFATLAYIAKGLATLKLTLDQQAGILADAPEIFTPAPGGWGRMGMTLMRLDAPDNIIVGSLRLAHGNVIARAKTRRTSPKSNAKRLE